MFNDGRVGGIEYYKQLLNQQGSNQSPAGSIGLWQKLTDYCNKMSADQQSFVERSPKVQETRAKMMDAFILFLFERHKDEFVQLNNFQKLCEDYVDSVIETGKDYSNQIAHTVNENADLKARIAELERKINEQPNQPNTNGA